jgi:IS4 transposase
MSVTGMGPLSVRITGERSADCRNFKVGKWVANRLLLFDLGYFSYHLFDCIARNRGFFVTRAKSTINPRIVAVNRRWRGRSRSLVGQRLQDVLGTLRRGVLDVMVEVEFKRRRYRGKQSSGVNVFRLVGILNQDTGEYHLYMTNIPADRLDAEDIARVYRARWEVELIFKELKSHYQLDRLPSTKAHIVEALIYTAILTLIVSRKMLVALRRLRGVGANRTPERRWTIAFPSCAARLLDLLLDPSSAPALWRRLEEFLTREFLDPNRSRSRNLSVAWS